MPESDHQEFTALSAPHVISDVQNANTLPDANCASASPLDADERLAFLSSPETSTTLQPLSRTNDMVCYALFITLSQLVENILSRLVARKLNPSNPFLSNFVWTPTSFGKKTQRQ